MSAQRTEPNADRAEQSAEQPTDSRVFPAERAFPAPSDKPAWKRLDSDLSGGYEDVSLACWCAHPDDIFEDVTSS